MIVSALCQPLCHYFSKFSGFISLFQFLKAKSLHLNAMDPSENICLRELVHFSYSAEEGSLGCEDDFLS